MLANINQILAKHLFIFRLQIIFQRIGMSCRTTAHRHPIGSRIGKSLKHGIRSLLLILSRIFRCAASAFQSYGASGDALKPSISARLPFPSPCVRRHVTDHLRLRYYTGRYSCSTDPAKSADPQSNRPLPHPISPPEQPTSITNCPNLRGIDTLFPAVVLPHPSFDPHPCHNVRTEKSQPHHSHH